MNDEGKRWTPSQIEAWESEHQNQVDAACTDIADRMRADIERHASLLSPGGKASREIVAVMLAAKMVDAAFGIRSEFGADAAVAGASRGSIAVAAGQERTTKPDRWPSFAQALKERSR